MKVILALVLVIPSIANAELLFVDYEGTVPEGNADRYPPGYAPGDPFNGRLVIDTALAPANSSREPWAGNYSIDEPELGPDFVTGFVPPNPAGGTDGVTVVHQDPPGSRLDEYVVRDDQFYYRGLSLYIAARLHDFLPNTDLVQSFDVTDADVDEPREELVAVVQDPYAGETGYEMTVWLRRIFVHPAGMCRPKG